MQEDKHIENIFRKFILNECNEGEIVEIITYIKSMNNSDGIPSVEEVLEIIEEKPIMEEIDASVVYEKIQKILNDKKESSLRKLKYFWRYAVAFLVIGVLATTYFIRDNFDNPNNVPTSVISNQIEIGTDKATLTLEDGSKVVLEKGKIFQSGNAKSNGEELVYETKTENTPVIKFNYLTIPRGGEFFLELSDGTKIWLNSETQLKYPTSFDVGETRQVELVYGEAYFEVSPSEKHNGSKFKVINDLQEVEVYGTQFNIRAYKDEPNISTTLVEGKVAISTSVKKQILEPNQQTILNTQNEELTFIPEVDVNDLISWKNGIFSFKEKSLEDIMKTLSRWYDVDIVIKNEELVSKKFTGTLSKKIPIEKILSIMQSTTKINYTMNTDEIIIE